MNKLILLLFLTQTLNASELHSLAGNWNFQDSNDIERFVTAEIKIKNDKLQIHHCSQKYTPTQLTCFDFDYILSNEKILIGNRKVGDLYPYSLMVYDSNGQYAEMLKIQLRNKNQIDYTYSYSNMDGDVMFIKAQLDKLGLPLILN